MEERSTRARKWLYSYIALVLLAALIGGIAGSFIFSSYLARKGPIQYRPSPGGEKEPVRIVYPEEKNPNIISAVAEKNIPSVVSITTVQVERDALFRATEVRGVGSGVIVSPDGYILTNDHVIGRNPREITVLFENGDEMAAEVLWQDSGLDLALVRVNATGLPSAELGDSDSLKVGEVAVAIGSPLGLRFQRTVTSGIISALNRTILVPADDEEIVMEDLIQTDASINPGNSGGPLLNARGQVIGINTIKASGAEAIGFAVPINIAKPVIRQIIEKGTFRPMYLGIDGFDKEIAGYYNSDVDIKKGIYVIRVHPNSPAQEAGIGEGDIILEMDGKEVNTLIKMRNILYSIDKPRPVDVKIKRDGKIIKVKVNLRHRPQGY